MATALKRVTAYQSASEEEGERKPAAETNPLGVTARRRRMLEQGHIRLYRSLLNWEWYGDIQTSRVFVHLLLTVNYTEQRWRGMVVERGQRITSLQGLAGETGLSVQNIRTALAHLTQTGEISCESTNRYSKITVNQYNRYQAPADGTASHPQTNGMPATNGPQRREKAKKNERSKTAMCEISAAWDELCPSLPRAGPMTPERRRAMEQLGVGEEELRDGFRRVEESDFLAGRQGGWHATLDWVLRPQNWQKLQSGRYRNPQTRRRSGCPQKEPGKASYDLAEFEEQSLYEPLIYEGSAMDAEKSGLF